MLSVFTYHWTPLIGENRKCLSPTHNQRRATRIGGQSGRESVSPDPAVWRALVLSIRDPVPELDDGEQSGARRSGLRGSPNRVVDRRGDGGA